MKPRDSDATGFARVFVDERAVISVVLLNTVALLMMETHADRALWFWLDYACVVYFIIEQIVKIRRRGLSEHLHSGWARLDLAVVVLSAPVLITPWVPISRLSDLLILRMGRLLRLLRLLRFVPDRERVASGIARSLRASMGVFLAVMLVNLILAMGAVMLFRDLAPEYFGHPAKAFYSMFQVFTVEGWYEIPDLIASRAGSDGWAALARGYFLGAVLVGGILGLSLANAVFVDQMTLDNTRVLEDEVGELKDEVAALHTKLDRLLDRK